jgi:hypothetical protein
LGWIIKTNYNKGSLCHEIIGGVKIKRRPKSLLLSTAGLNRQISTNMTEKKRKLKQRKKVASFFSSLWNLRQKGANMILLPQSTYIQTQLMSVIGQREERKQDPLILGSKSQKRCLLGTPNPTYLVLQNPNRANPPRRSTLLMTILIESSRPRLFN